MCSSRRAITGKRAHSALPQTMKAAARAITARSTGAWTAKRMPATIAPTTRSGVCGGGFRVGRQRTTWTTTSEKTQALNA
ncbi:hypothetical protein OV079_01885 [Nannocystis pusilla]|uniref:Uncharacterized protein n=1 Tax=Nannocystis pusilla TaxID=889268 RepID=A0A9X3IVD2_9BACT|nr:hypothetical protein [Nannocystis pusilla]MCY1004334.1 hypothetical protein [Nannocystis pusilla]